MKNILLFLVTIFFMIGCNSQKKKATDPSTEQITKPSGRSRPDTIQTTVAIEGMKQSMRMYLLKSSDHLPLDFSTYIPGDMKTETVHIDEGAAIRIMANFGGQLNKEAQLMIYAFPAETDTATARKKAEAKVRTFGTISEDPDRYPWAETVYSIEGKRTGFLALGQKNNHWFYLLAAYPPEYGDGMGPRIHKIIRQWRWEDNGKFLAR